MEDDFIDFMHSRADEVEGTWFQTFISGAQHSNQDGSSRQAFIRLLSERRELELVPEPHNPFHDKAVRIQTKRKEQLGYLTRDIAEQVTAQITKGYGFKCFVRRVDKLESGHFGALIGIVKYDIAYKNRPQKHKDFERWINQVAKHYRGIWNFVKLTRIHTKNADGGDRGELITKLLHRDQLRILADDPDPAKANAVYIGNHEKQIIGHLEKKMATAVLAHLTVGKACTAFFRDYELDEAGRIRPVVALLILESRPAEASKIV